MNLKKNNQSLLLCMPWSLFMRNKPMFTQGRMKGFAQGLTLSSFRVSTEQCPCVGGSPFSGGSVPGCVGCSWVAFFREIFGVKGPLFIQSSRNHCKELFAANSWHKSFAVVKVFLHYLSNEMPFFNLTLLWCFKNVFSNWLKRSRLSNADWWLSLKLPVFCKKINFFPYLPQENIQNLSIFWNGRIVFYF